MLSEATQEDVALRVAVLGRASPADKSIFARALRKRGDVVALTGGGVDDTPVLRRADVGFAKGIGGTDSACSADSCSYELCSTGVDNEPPNKEIAKRNT